MISVVITALFLAFTAVLVYEARLLMGQADWLVEGPGQLTTERHRAELRAMELAEQCSVQEYQQCLVARVDNVASGIWRSELTVDADYETKGFSLCYLIVLNQFRRSDLAPAPLRPPFLEDELLVTCPPGNLGSA
jgi:hypothetical protein